MKILTKFILICLSVIFYVSAVFLFNGPVADAESKDANERGKVLGVSNVSSLDKIEQEEEPKLVYYGLPENRTKRLIPEKKNNIESVDSIGSIGVVMDAKSGSILFEKDAQKIVPIASITKLATALVFLEQEVDWNNIYEIGDRDRVDGGRIYLHRGDKVKVKDLFYLSLVASANSATQAMVYSTGLDNDEFVKRMNLKMRELGLTNTVFEDTVGLSINNKSNAVEVAKLAKAALTHDEIMEATMLKKYDFTTEQGEKKIAQSTDFLLDSLGGSDIKILGGKTGYTDSAGYCFVGKYVNNEGNELLSVVLQENNVNSRFEKSKMLALWAFNNYLW